MRHPSLIPLSHDHHHALALALRCRKQALGQIKPTGLNGLRERATEVRGFYASNLVPHFRAEEEVLFPLLRSLVPESRSLIDQLMQDHEQIRSAMVRLEGGSQLGKMLFDVGDLLETHVRKEERELFPLFEKHASEKEAQTAGSKIKAILENSAVC
jgi:iron-sulfur cluster repair protein YtfE (RIC family)